jgi:hypothetical protein
MAAKHYLAMIAGRLTEIIATMISAGRCRTTARSLLLTRRAALIRPLCLWASGPIRRLSPRRKTLAAGDYVNIWTSTGTKVRKADASDISTMAHGSSSPLSCPARSRDGLFRRMRITQLSGLTPGTFWLSETAGQVTQTPVTTAGAIVQSLGCYKSATEGSTEIGDPVILA